MLVRKTGLGGSKVVRTDNNEAICVSRSADRNKDRLDIDLGAL